MGGGRGGRACVVSRWPAQHTIRQYAGHCNINHRNTVTDTVPDTTHWHARSDAKRLTCKWLVLVSNQYKTVYWLIAMEIALVIMSWRNCKTSVAYWHTDYCWETKQVIYLCCLNTGICTSFNTSVGTFFYSSCSNLQHNVLYSLNIFITLCTVRIFVMQSAVLIIANKEQ